MGSLWHQNLKRNVSNKCYYDLLTSWQQILEVTTISKPMNMPLWYNPHISKSIFFQKNMYLNGCILIADVCNMDGQVLSCDVLVEFFRHHCGFLDYYRLKTGLINYFKKFNITGPVFKPIQPTLTGLLSKHRKGIKIFYELLVERANIKNVKDYQRKWSNVLSKELSHAEWKKIFTICFDLIKDNDLVWLQYRIIHKILGTRSLLFKMSKAETNLCRNCGLSEETIEHLFFHCAKVKEFLLNVNRWAEPLTGIKCQFTIQEVLLGVIRVGSHSDALNILLLLIKDYIFQETLKGFSLNITAFSHKLHQIYKEQEFLATINLQLPTSLRKWTLFKGLVYTQLANTD